MWINCQNKNKKILNTKNYDNLISLGYNCEIAFRILNYYGEIRSSLFNWTYAYSIGDLIYALNNFDLICTGDMIKPNPLWECKNTKIRFHGRLPMTIWLSNEKVDDKIANDDLAELKSRTEYLKTKFIKIATEKNLKNLFIYKMKSSDFETCENGVKNINLLFEVLNKLSNNEFELLIILEENPMINNLTTSLNNEHIYIRTVKNFAPDDNVTSPEYDISDWKLILDEFILKAD